MKKLILIFTSVMITQVNAVEVPKDNWVNAMKSALPAAFCNSSMYFRQCFSVTAEQCEETAASTTRICLKNNDKDIPNTLIQPKDGTHWGTIIGSCAGEAYETTLMKNKISNAKCNDISNWQ
jgi:hypothetical protein